MTEQNENIHCFLIRGNDGFPETVNLLMAQILILRYLLIRQVVYFGMPDQENFKNGHSVGTEVLSLAMALPASGEIFC